MIISMLSLVICLAALLYDYRKSNYLVVVNPFVWLLLLFTLYFVLPSIFTEEINYYFNWDISRGNILYTRLLILILSLFFSSILLIFSSNVFVIEYDKRNSNYFLLYLLWMVVIFYVSWVFKVELTSNILKSAFLYDADAAKDPYKLKNIAYILIPITTYLFIYRRKYWIFIPNIIISLVDMLHGSRTTALICLIPMIISIIIINKKIYLSQMIILFLVMILVGIVRSNNVVQDVPWYLNAIGEFRETFITLPKFISDQSYLGQGTFFGYLGNLFIGILQPLREQITNEYIFPGVFIANSINRGYGLGANFIIESLYYGYVVFVLSLVLLISFCWIIYNAIRMLYIENIIIIISTYIIFIRLIIREGASIYIGLFIFIILFYILPISMLKKIRL